MGDTKLAPFDRGTFGSLRSRENRSCGECGGRARRTGGSGAAQCKWTAKGWSRVMARSPIRETGGRWNTRHSPRTAPDRDLPAEDPLIPATQWKVAGQSIPKVDGRDFCHGQAPYPSDQRLPDSWHGKMLRRCIWGLAGVLDTKQRPEAMPGVTVVAMANFVGVSAPTVEIASRAIAPSKGNEPTQLSRRDLFRIPEKRISRRSDPTGDRGAVVTARSTGALAAADHRLDPPTLCLT